MTSGLSLPQRTTPSNRTPQGKLNTMGRAIRSPSPAANSYIASASQTPKSPLHIRREFIDTDTEALFGEKQPRPTLPRSRTPTLQLARTHWHGIQSPLTPSYGNDIKKRAGDQVVDPAESTVNNESDDVWHSELTQRNTRPSFSPISPARNSTPISSDTLSLLDHDQLTLIERDAELALQLSSPVSVRRSTRLLDKSRIQADKPKAKVEARRPVIKVPSTSIQDAAQIILTQAEPTESPFEVAVSSEIESPVLHSCQWQLMYPPSGSTHPSYPWPSADPRLTFHAYHVPLRNGLPDVSCVPPLVLPPGWRQASWAGLHPIVFDPFQQGFKLTPVGPLALTSEEVHQGGLQDYVPCGRLHPEYGTLPIISSLSDGSDDVVYNFEGVDWKLPWAQVEGGLDFDAVDRKWPAMLGRSAATGIEVATYYVEERDCPDNVTDLEDGWRWVREWNPNTTTAFTATPGKTWLRSGISLTTLKMKQPIASLMALTMSDKTPGVDHWLVKQSRREFCPLRSVATPANVDITLLDDVEFTIVELLSYFPLHYKWWSGANRLVRCGMSASHVANFINMVRRLPAGSLCNASTVHSYLRMDRDEEDNNVQVEPSSNDEICYTAQYWRNLAWSETTDYPLLGLVVGLRELPSGIDAGPLTKLIRWCRDKARNEVMLSEVPGLLEEAGLESLIDTGTGADIDKGVIARYTDAIKGDRRRVLEEQQSLKKQKEAFMEVGADDTARQEKVKKRRLG